MLELKIKDDRRRIPKQCTCFYWGGLVCTQESQKRPSRLRVRDQVRQVQLQPRLPRGWSGRVLPNYCCIRRNGSFLFPHQMGVLDCTFLLLHVLHPCPLRQPLPARAHRNQHCPHLLCQHIPSCTWVQSCRSVTSQSEMHQSNFWWTLTILAQRHLKTLKLKQKIKINQNH